MTLKTCAGPPYAMADGLFVQPPDRSFVAAIRRDQLPGAELKPLLPQGANNLRTKTFLVCCHAHQPTLLSPYPPRHDTLVAPIDNFIIDVYVSAALRNTSAASSALLIYSKIWATTRGSLVTVGKPRWGWDSEEASTGCVQ